MSYSRFLFLAAGCLAISLCANKAHAQGVVSPTTPITLQNTPQRDTTNREAKRDWHDEPVTIFAQRAVSVMRLYPDTAIHNFQRRPFQQSWYRDLGNLGSPARSQLFRPECLGQTGPSLGYRVYDVYRFFTDSLLYYNTTRPYTIFAYQLGSRLEQTLNLLHTQNISPRWNFAVQYRKINSPGYYKLQRSNDDAGALSTHYESKGQHYELWGAIVYNKEQTDENGGIPDDSLLSLSRYSDRQTIPVALDNPSYYNSSSAGRRSAITNVLRDFNVRLRHQYTLGKRDTIYNADSTQYNIRLTPRFSISHRFEAGSEKHRSANVAPDSLIYISFFNRGFASQDSVTSIQGWSWVDNVISLNGFFGKTGKQAVFSAGIGNRVDAFYTNYETGRDAQSILSNYLTGALRKEGLTADAWNYEAGAKLFITGTAAGDFLLNGSAGKGFGRLGAVRIGASQQLTQAPYAYTIFQNQYFRQDASLSKESITTIWAEVTSERLGLYAGLRNYVVSNYIYLADSLRGISNGRLQILQNGSAFNLTQATLRKIFRFGSGVLDNEIALQQVTGDAPVSVPLLLGRHALSYESNLFSRALRIATGAEVRYHSDYHAEGYAPFYNRFYYQTTYTSSNKPELNAFFNFRIKRFRAYLMLDQIQTLWWRNTVIHPGYPSQDLMIRFGFAWVLVN